MFEETVKVPFTPLGKLVTGHTGDVSFLFLLRISEKKTENPGSAQKILHQKVTSA